MVPTIPIVPINISVLDHHKLSLEASPQVKWTHGKTRLSTVSSDDAVEIPTIDFQPPASDSEPRQRAWSQHGQTVLFALT